MVKSAPLAAALALIAANALALGPHDDHASHQHSAHVHGSWELFAALDGAQLTISIKGPAIDALGFETAPSTNEERAAAAALQTQLAHPETLLTLDARANCALAEPTAVSMPGGVAHELEDRGAQSDQGDDHHDHHHDHHDHDRDDDHGDESHHSAHTDDIEVAYVFECGAPNRLRSIAIKGFETFPSIEAIDAVFLSDAATVSQRLTKKSTTLKID